VKTRLTCPCGEVIRGADEDELVSEAEAHLAAEHGRTYTREEILFIAL
jgi:predicted small metal-binding protein